LRAKGLDDEGPSRLTYTGPDEDGKAKATRDSAADSGDGAASRRERREAARTQSKSNRAPKSKRKR
jgi:preprotein translocase subunit SecA